MILSAGARLGPYQVVAALGAGGMGHVYRAHDARLGRDVAVKLVAENLTRNRSAVDRFVREARAASRLNHPNIVTIHEIGEAEAGRFIVMELVEGRTLREMATDRVAWELVVDVGRQIARALAAAHAAGIVHRDVKPENVMVRDDGLVKVLDFGLARLLSTHVGAPEANTASGTEAGIVLGTLRYLAPEQARGEPVSGAADVFALGLVLYELTTGRHPFGANRSIGVVDAIVSDPALPPSRLNPEIPGTLEAALLQMLEKDPRRRPTAAEVDALLTHMSAPVPVARASQLRARAPDTSVGREGERAVLRAVFDSAASGNGLLVCVAGEPGIGKTTLVENFLVEIEDEGFARVARGRCSERLAGTEAYLPWIEALEDLLRSDSGAEMARLMRLVAPSWYAQVAPTDAGHEAPNEPGAASQERIKREVATFLQEAVRVRPLVLFLDDVHWSDVSTVDLLAYVGTKLSSMRMLIVVTYRPSELALSQHPFGSLKLDLQSRRICREVSLGFLSHQDVGDYLALEFPGHQFPAEFGAFIHAKTEGSPLFISGLLRDLRDREVVAQVDGCWNLVRTIPVIDRELPESVRSMIQRTIEKLAEEDRHLLIAASVQGYEFDSAIVARAIDEDAAHVEERLETLERVHAFVRRVRDRDLPDRTLSVRYRFVHVLYQNVLYGSVPPTRRAALSAAVANALTAHYGDARSEIASELALLFESARDSQRATEHFLVAARRAARVFAHEEAIVLARRALALLEAAPESPEREARELELLMTLGSALSVAKGFSARVVEEVFARARELCRRTEDTEQLFSALHGLRDFYITRGERQTAHDLSGELYALAERANDSHLRLQARHGRWTALIAEGEFVVARACLEEGLALYDREKHGSPPYAYGGHDPGVCCHVFSALGLWALGHPDQALTRSRDALTLARALAHPFSVAQAQFYAAVVHQLRGEAADARKHADTTITLTRDQSLAFFLSLAEVVHGWAVAALGEADQGMTEVRKGLQEMKATGTRFLLPYCLTLLTEVALGAGLQDEAFAAVAEGLDEVRRSGQSFSESELHRLEGELHLLRLDQDPAETCFKEAIVVARRQSAKAFELRAATSLARLWHAQHRQTDARHMLEGVYLEFSEGLDTTDLREARRVWKI